MKKVGMILIISVLIVAFFVISIVLLQKYKEIKELTNAVAVLQNENSKLSETITEQETELIELELLKRSYNSLEKELNDYKHLKKLLEDIRKLPNDFRTEVVSLCYTESTLKYNVIHKSATDKTTIGICGIKPELWKKVIKDYHPNSLYSGYLVLNHLLDYKNDNFFKAIAYYKGAVKNQSSTHKVLALNEFLEKNYKNILENF